MWHHWWWVRLGLIAWLVGLVRLCRGVCVVCTAGGGGVVCIERGWGVGAVCISRGEDGLCIAGVVVCTA